MSKPATTKIVAVNELHLQEPYATLVCYPKATAEEIEKRIIALRELGVEALEFSGKTTLINVPVLGKGQVGVVVIAHMGGQRFALKMRRLDADRPSLEREAELLKKVNSIGVGPQFLAVSKDFLLMQLIDGCLIYDWLEDHKDKALIRHLLVDVLEQCWRLDEAGIDHGEISKAARHLLVDKSDKPFLVDFETASVTRSVINVTSLCQFLFQGNSDACISIAQTLGERNRIKLTEALKNYKKERNRSNFEAILMVALA